MGRRLLSNPAADNYFNTETYWNEITTQSLASGTRRGIHVVILDNQGNQIVPGGAVGGNTADRTVSLTDNTAIAVTPTANAREIHIFNDTGQTLRYGGSSVTTGTGGKLFNQGTLVFKNPDSDFSIWFIQSSGGALDLDIVEFF